MHISDLEKHQRFGFAIVDKKTGRVTWSTTSFANMVGQFGKVDIKNVDLSDLVDASERQSFIYRVGRACSGNVSFDSFCVTFKNRLALEINAVQGPEKSSLFLVVAKSDDLEKARLSEKLEEMHDKFVVFAELAMRAKQAEININTTNVTGNDNQSIQGDKIEDVSRG